MPEKEKRTATVIYSNFGDEDTKVLRKLWDGIEGVKVIEVLPESRNPQKMVDKAISEEKDLLILCGHGGPDGLFYPNYSFRYLINEDNASLIKAARTVGIWCFASSFAKKNKLRGFYSSMFISNSNEADYFNVPVSDPALITEYESDFCQDLCDLIKDEIPMEDWKETLISKADMEKNEVVAYNYNGLCYLDD